MHGPATLHSLGDIRLFLLLRGELAEHAHPVADTTWLAVFMLIQVLEHRVAIAVVLGHVLLLAARPSQPGAVNTIVSCV